MTRPLTRYCAVALLLVTIGCRGPAPQTKVPEQIFVGTFVTLGNDVETVDAIAVTDGVIVAAGAADETLAMGGPHTNVIPIPGVAVPGWIDGHVHISGLGKQLSSLNIQGMSRSRIAAAVAEAVRTAAEGEWIVGRGWDEGFFEDSGYPSAADIDPVSPHNPVILHQLGGHAVWVNSAALEAAGIDRDSSDPPGGRILRDADGNPSGMLLEQAEALVTGVMPDMNTPQHLEREIRLALDQYRRWGLTGVHDAGSSLTEIDILKKLAERGELPLRVYAMAKGDAAVKHYLQSGPEVGLGNDTLTIRSFKINIDGALGARGAQLSDPYSDDPGTSGLPQMTDDEIDAFIATARASGFQVNAHVIGDLGVQRFLDALERNAVPAAERFRLEHASIISPQNLQRFAELGAVASMQPVFIGEYQRWGVDRVGTERAPWIMPMRDLFDTGALIAAGTDYPASDSGDPRTTLNALVNRSGFDGEPDGGWFPEQALDVETALRLMSAGSAYAAFEESTLGALTVGRYADFTVLADDPRSLQSSDLLRIEVTMTVVGGVVTFEK
ncbi:MAG: amidohydrolase [Woeseiaceae bacterium]|nr:amidohydrolase [Woeseiaceae bacterium]